MEHQDWDDVVLGGPGGRRQGSRTQQVNQAQRQGQLRAERKHTGSNSSAHAGPSNARKLEEDTENFKTERVDRSLAQNIRAARAERGMTQKALATAISEKPAVVQSYESGSAVPNQQIISKLERALGVSLRGGGRGRGRGRGRGGGRGGGGRGGGARAQSK